MSIEELRKNPKTHREKNSQKKRTAERDDVVMRRLFVFQLRRDEPGISMDMILLRVKQHFKPEQLPEPYTENDVWHDVRAMYKKVARKMEHLVEMQFQEDLELIDWMLRGLRPQIAVGDPASIREARALMNRRAQMLGLDQPLRFAPVTPDGKEAYNPAQGLDDEQLRDAVEALLTQGELRELVSPFARAEEEAGRTPDRQYPGPEEVSEESNT